FSRDDTSGCKADRNRVHKELDPGSFTTFPGRRIAYSETPARRSISLADASAATDRLSSKWQLNELTMHTRQCLVAAAIENQPPITHQSRADIFRARISTMLLTADNEATLAISKWSKSIQRSSVKRDWARLTTKDGPKSDAQRPSTLSNSHPRRSTIN